MAAGPLVRFNLRGNRTFSDAVLASHLVLDSDDPLDAQAAQELASRLRRFYVTAGFLREFMHFAWFRYDEDLREISAKLKSVK